MTNDLQERQNRWKQIENICNFPVVNDGLFANLPSRTKYFKRNSVAEVVTEIGAMGVKAIENSTDERREGSEIEPNGNSICLSHDDSFNDSDESGGLQIKSLPNACPENYSTQISEILHVNSITSPREVVQNPLQFPTEIQNNMPHITSDSQVNHNIRTKLQPYTRSNTEPNNMAGLEKDLIGLGADVKHFQTIPLTDSTKYSASSVHLPYQNGPTSSQNHNSGLTHSEPEYYSDESITSTSSVSKKKTGLRKFFSKRSKRGEIK